jgi:O-antigen/teichoic acid export membrane protein
LPLKKNVIANFLGQGWIALMGMAFVPLYVKYLGAEAYGLIGIFALLQAWLALFDLGMTPALGREMARFRGGGHSVEAVLDLLRSIEVIGFVIAGLIALGIWGASSWLASDWLKAGSLPIDVVANAFAVMGVVTALRFVESLYRSSIVGLQKQVLLNGVASVMATLRGAGAVGVLVWVSPTVGAFFLWQGLMSAISVVILAVVLYGALPGSSRKARFSMSSLKGVWRFSASMVGITFLSLLLTQVDKVLLSRLLSLESFGYYSLAVLVANTLYMAVVPIVQAFYPRFTELVTSGDEQRLIADYHMGAQLVSVFMGAATGILVFHGDALLALWTGDVVLVQRVGPLLSVLAVGTFLHGLMWIPYHLQLAHGWTSLSIRINVIAVMLLVPAIAWSAQHYGAIGAAWAWLILNAGYLLIGVHFMYKRMLPAEKWRWYWQDIGLPIGASWLVAWLGGRLVQNDLGIAQQLLSLLGACVLTFVTAVLATGGGRMYLRRCINRVQ